MLIREYDDFYDNYGGGGFEFLLCGIFFCRIDNVLGNIIGMNYLFFLSRD